MSTLSGDSDSKRKIKHAALRNKRKEPSKIEPKNAYYEELSEDKKADGLALPQKGARWDPANERWVRGVTTVIIVATVPISVTIAGIGLISQRANVQDLSVFLSMAFTPASGIVGFFFGRRHR